VKKKDCFKSTCNEKTYEIAGRWGGSIILSPVDTQDEECLIYTIEEIKEFLQTGQLIKLEKEKKALFGRKIADLETLKSLTRAALKRGQSGSAYQGIKEVSLTEDEFHRFASNFLLDQPWIGPEDGGVNKRKEIRCIRVINRGTGEKVLVNCEGYTYPRYTALEK